MSAVDAFVRAIHLPPRERAPGVDIEPDETFRVRIMAVCAPRDRPHVDVAEGFDLDRIGNLHGLIRGGLR